MLGIDSLCAALFLSYWNVTATWQFVVLCGLCDALGSMAGSASLPLLCLGAVLCGLRDRWLILPFVLAIDNVFVQPGPDQAIQDGLTSAALAAVGFSLGACLPLRRSWQRHATSMASGY